MMSDEFLDKHKPERVLVTGGGGFLGQAIVSRLAKRGDHVRSLARNFYPELEAMGVDQIRGDISDSETVARACEGRTIVYHVAAKPPPGEGMQTTIKPMWLELKTSSPVVWTRINRG